MRLQYFQFEMKLPLLIVYILLFHIGAEAKPAEIDESSIITPSETSPLKIHSNKLSILRGRPAPFAESGADKTSVELKPQSKKVMPDNKVKGSMEHPEKPSELYQPRGSRLKPHNFIFREWTKRILPRGSVDLSPSATNQSTGMDYMHKKYHARKRKIRTHRPTSPPNQEVKEQNMDGEFVTTINNVQDATKCCEEHTTIPANKTPSVIVHIIGSTLAVGTLLIVAFFYIMKVFTDRYEKIKSEAL